MARRSYRHAISVAAWLGLIAMWLLVAAPTISRIIAASDAIVIQVCTASTDSDGGSAHTYHLQLDGDQSRPLAPLQACGYCNLLAYGSLLPAVPPAALNVLLVAIFILATALHALFIPAATFPAGRPRDPPLVS